MEYEVKVFNMAFSPQELVIDPGDTVRWTNYDFVPHQVAGQIPPELQYAVSGYFETPVLPANRTSDGIPLANSCLEFPLATFLEYSCKFHPEMKGKITVRIRQETDTQTKPQ